MGVVSITNNFFFSILITIIRGFVNSLYPLIVGLVFSPTIMGQFAVLISWAVLVAIPIANGIAPTISRFTASNKKEAFKDIFNLGYSTSFLYVFLIIAILPTVGLLFFELTFMEIFAIFMLFLTSIFHFVFRQSMQGKENFKLLFYYELAAIAVFLPLSVIICTVPILSQTSANFVIFLILPMILYHLVFDLIFIFRGIKKKIFTKPFNFANIFTKRFLRYALLVGIGSFFGLGIAQINIIISEMYLSEFEVGVLAFWAIAASLIALLSVTLNTILIPRISQLQRHSPDSTVKFVNILNWSFAYILVPIIGMIFLFIAGFPIILDFVSLNKYNMVKYWPIVILYSLNPINTLLGTPSLAVLATSEKYVKFNPFISFIFSLFIVVSWIIFVPSLGIFGFALAFAIGGYVANIAIQAIAFIVHKRKLGYHTIFFLLSSGLVGLGIYLQMIIEPYIVLMIWGTATIPFIYLGIRKLYRLVKNKEFLFIND